MNKQAFYLHRFFGRPLVLVYNIYIYNGNEGIPIICRKYNDSKESERNKIRIGGNKMDLEKIRAIEDPGVRAMKINGTMYSEYVEKAKAAGVSTTEEADKFFDEYMEEGRSLIVDECPEIEDYCDFTPNGEDQGQFYVDCGIWTERQYVEEWLGIKWEDWNQN